MTQARSQLNPAHRPVPCIAPFDAERHAACTAFITGQLAKQRNSRTQLYIVKALILTDLYALQHGGAPIVGGPLQAWPQGPVNRDAYEQLVALIEAKKAHMPLPPGFTVERCGGKAYEFQPDQPVDPDDYSPLEISAMTWAWGEIGHLTYKQLEHYTHSSDTYMGAAWRHATGGEWMGNATMDWLRLMWEFDRAHDTDHYGRMADYILSSPSRSRIGDAGEPDVEVDDLGHVVLY